MEKKKKKGWLLSRKPMFLLKSTKDKNKIEHIYEEPTS